MAHANDWLMWTARKLASQSPGYLPRRLRYVVQKRWADLVFPTPWMAQRAELVLPDSARGLTLREHLRKRFTPTWHWIGGEISSIVRSVPESRRIRAVGVAEDILNRQFAFRGTDAVTLAPGEWAPHSVSHDWVCDLNRHHWFATLGFAYWYTGDARFLRNFIAESSDWMDQHLEGLGRLPWDSPFEVASRINAWLWAHFLFLPSPDWDPTHHERFLRGLGLLAEYLSQAIEYHSPGNHILLEAKALALCGEVFPEFVGAARWRRKGWRILSLELREQICRDGVHAERSTMYHRIVAGELADLWLFCRLNRRPQAAALGEAIERMAEFEAWLDQGGGCLPLFGDAHAEDTYCRFSVRAAVAAAHGTAAVDLITEPTDHGFWLLGDRWNGFSSAPPPDGVPPGRAFPEGGYFVARSGWRTDADVLVWDCGPVGYSRNRKHAHLDALSFTLSVEGTPLLIDPGTAEDDDRREALRSTRAHTTMCIDGAEQGALAERSEIWSPPRPELLLWATSEECTVMSGRHDGYRHLREPVSHVRTILTMRGLYWLVVDSLEGSGEHRAEQRFHVAPGAQVICSQDAGRVELTKNGVSVALCWALGRTEGPKDLVAALPHIRLEPSLAELFCGHQEATSIVTAEREGLAPFSLAVVISPAGRGVLVSNTSGAERTGRLTVSGPGFKHQVYLGGGVGEPIVLAGGWSSDARVAIIRDFEGAEPHDMLLVGASRMWREHCEYPADAAGRQVGVGLRRIVLEPVGSVQP